MEYEEEMGDGKKEGMMVEREKRKGRDGVVFIVLTPLL